jgi:transposase InsO family protein
MRVNEEVLPFERVHMDIWGPVVDEEEKKMFVLSIIDKSTRWAEATIIPNKTSDEIARTFLTSWVTRYGVPTTVVSDSESCFTDAHLKNLYALLGIKNVTSTVYHPMGNSPVETFHRKLKKGLSMLKMQTKDLRLDEALQLVLYGYRTSINLSTQETPSFLTFGLDIALPPEREWQKLTHKDTKNRLEVLSNLRFEALRRAQEANKMAVEKQNLRRRNMKFEVHDLILVRLTDKQLEKLSRFEGSRKLLPTWSVPCRVMEVKRNGFTALYKNLLTSEVGEVHITRARFISEPVSDYQKDLWTKSVDQVIEESIITSPEKRNLLIQRFWRRVDMLEQERSCLKRIRESDESVIEESGKRKRQERMHQ